MSKRRVDGAKNLHARPGSTLVIIGNFDGVHRGHQAVLAASADVARAQGLTPIVLTFHPHPAEVLGRGVLPALTTLDRKIELIERIDPAYLVVVEPFDADLARLEPDAFADRLLARELCARSVVVGQNFRFGRHRAGDLSALARFGEQFGFSVRAEPLHGDDNGPFSSTRVRASLANGDLADVALQLGRPHSLSGRVIQGAGRGRMLDVPTANLGTVPEALPPYGVYACLVDLLGRGGPRALASGVANVGIRPTVGGGFGVEAHLFDFEADLYGAELRVHLIRRIRDERRFPDVSELKAQIQRDIAFAKTSLAGAVPEEHGAWF